MSFAVLRVTNRQGEQRALLELDPQRIYRIGRAPDNDVVIDDPYVAAHHASVTYNQTTQQWVLSDNGSVNGLLVNKDKHTVRELVLSADQSVGIGQSRLHWYSAQAALPPERPLPVLERAARQPWLSVWVLAPLLLLGIANYLQTVPPLPPNFWLGVFKEPLLMVVGWTLAWALLARVFAGNPWFTQHLSIACRAGLAILLVPWLIGNVAYAFSWPSILPAADVSAYLIIAWAVYHHCRIVFGEFRWIHVLGFVAVALLPMISGMVKEKDRRNLWFDNQVVKRLPDPAWQVVSSKTPDELFKGLQDQKAQIDAMRMMADVREED